MIAPQHAKAYVRRNKNDAADAEALCEAMSRPRMNFVAAKSAEEQAALMLAGMRRRLIKMRTQLANAIRSYAAEFGLFAAKGLGRIEPLLEQAAVDQTLPELARQLFALQAGDYAKLDADVRQLIVTGVPAGIVSEQVRIVGDIGLDENLVVTR